MLTAANPDFMSDLPATTSTDSAVSSGADGDVIAFPASVAQQVFWYLELFQEGVTAFNVPLRFRLEGPLDERLLERSIHTLIDRHEALRTHFEEEEGELLQVVSPHLQITIPVIDISHLPEDRMQEEIDRLGSIEARRPFKLSTGPVIRAELIRRSPVSHILHFTIHHSLFDGLSMTVATKELAAIYQAYFEGKPNPLEPLAIQYGDFSVWQNEFLQGPEVARQLSYWKKKLSGMKELELPTDHPRPATKSWNGEIVSRLLPRELTDKLVGYAANHGSSLFHLQLAAFKILMSRYCGTTDVSLGTPITGRTREELEPLIGVFINSLILRTDLSANPTFENYLKQVRETVFEALENQELPFEYLVRELRPVRDSGRNPLFQVNFNHHKSFGKPGEFGGVTLTPMPSRSPGTIFDLHVFMVERKEGWRASCDYSTDLFEKATAERILGHFERLLQDIADHPEKPIAELEILTDAEKSTILHNWSATRPIHDRAEEPIMAEGPIYLLDDHGRMVPAGVPGVLHLSGGRTTKNLPSIDHPELGRLYPTREVCRWLADGNVDFLRSLDTPIPVATEKPRAVEPAPAIKNSPPNFTEQKLTSIWKELLGIPQIQRDDAFFTLGGHSLMALRMFSRIKRELGATLPLAALIRNPTIRSLSALIDAQSPKRVKTEEEVKITPAVPKETSATRGNLVTLSEDGPGDALFCIHGGDGGVLFYRELAERLRKTCPVHAIESLELGSSEPIQPTSVEETAQAYIEVLLAFQPHGPFRLAGYSFGGAVAFEMGCILRGMGHEVSFLGLFDTQNVSVQPRRYGLLERGRVFWRQQEKAPLTHRLGLLRKRILGGISTHRQVRREVKAAMAAGPAEAFSESRRIQVREENWRSMLAYRPNEFQGRITLFKTKISNDKVEWPSDYGWACHTTHGLDIIPVSGEHLTLFDTENIGALSKALADSLTPPP